VIIKNTKKEVKEVVTTEVQTECDICKKRVAGYYQPNWAEKGDFYAVGNTKISYHDGHIYPGGDCTGDKFEAHVCVECFVSKVRPALEAIGVVFHEVDD
jgi:hypothetical protein